MYSTILRGVYQDVRMHSVSRITLRTMKIQVQLYSFKSKDLKKTDKWQKLRNSPQGNPQSKHQQKQETILQQQVLTEQRYIYVVTNKTNDMQLEAMRPDRPSKG